MLAPPAAFRVKLSAIRQPNPTMNHAIDQPIDRSRPA
jgi:hypothetical protein